MTEFIIVNLAWIALIPLIPFGIYIRRLVNKRRHTAYLKRHGYIKNK